jgi:hypothetical protein
MRKTAGTVSPAQLTTAKKIMPDIAIQNVAQLQ